jgi:molybdopterin-binding protein
MKVVGTVYAWAVPRPVRSSGRSPELSLAELVCLTLVDDGFEHGWAVGSELAPDGALGRVWSLSRPLTYRALDQLAGKGLLERAAPPAGPGRERTLVSCTRAGRARVQQWLDAPVEHLRDVRTELLLKLELRRRRDLPLAPLLDAQERAFAGHFDALTAATSHDGTVVELWRRESARAVRRFLDAARAVEGGAAPEVGRPLMPLSARNQLAARVVSVSHGDVLSVVKAALTDGQHITAVITRDAAVDLDLAPDDEVLVVMKSTEVMLAKR